MLREYISRSVFEYLDSQQQILNSKVVDFFLENGRGAEAGSMAQCFFLITWNK